MGAAAGAPVAAVGACLGTALSTILCKFAMSGQVESNRGARCLLMWLQLFFVSVAWWFSIGPHGFTETYCGWFSDWFPRISEDLETEIGICACNNQTFYGDRYQGDNSTPGEVLCRREQSTLRLGLSTEIVFIFMLLLASSGCATSAARDLPVLKFLMIPVFYFIFLFLPNYIFDYFGEVANVVACFFFFAQFVLLLDFSYNWNSEWVTNAVRGEIDGSGTKWKVGNLLFSLLFLISGCAVAGLCIGRFSVNTWLPIVVLIVSWILLIISILEVVEHGNILTSAIMMFFASWMTWQALSVSTTDIDAWRPNVYVELVLAMLTLCVLICYDPTGQEEAAAAAPAVAAAPAQVELAKTKGDEEKGDGEKDDKKTEIIVVQTADANTLPPVNSWDFTFQCFVHSAAVMYFTAVLIPFAGNVPFISYTITIFLVLGAYGWSLIFPLVSNRDFGH